MATLCATLSASALSSFPGALAGCAASAYPEPSCVAPWESIDLEATFTSSIPRPFRWIQAVLMIDLAGATGFAAVSLAIALAPGPSWVYVISSTVRQGRMAGLAAVAGNGTGIICHVMAAAFGLSAVLHYSATLYTAIRWIGSLYLMFLAIRIVRERSTFSMPQRSCDKKTYWRVYRDGVLVNILNPKVSLLMLALLPQFVNPMIGHAIAQIAILGAFHVVIASTVLTLIVGVVTRATGLLRRRPTAETMLRWMTGTLLFGFGARMALAQTP